MNTNAIKMSMVTVRKKLGNTKTITGSTNYETIDPTPHSTMPMFSAVVLLFSIHLALEAEYYMITLS